MFIVEKGWSTLTRKEEEVRDVLKYVFSSSYGSLSDEEFINNDQPCMVPGFIMCTGVLIKKSYVFNFFFRKDLMFFISKDFPKKTTLLKNFS